MKPSYKKPPAPPSPPPPFNMKPQPDIESIIADRLAKFETEKPYLEALYAHEARGIKMRLDAFVNAGFTVDQAFEYIRTNK